MTDYALGLDFAAFEVIHRTREAIRLRKGTKNLHIGRLRFFSR